MARSSADQRGPTMSTVGEQRAIGKLHIVRGGNRTEVRRKYMDWVKFRVRVNKADKAQRL